jgi:putative nucleotidyltransferase with HDIG domain
MLKRLDAVKDLPTLPMIAVEVNKMLQDDNVTIEKLSEILSNDQAIVSKILRLVNSAFFGLRSRVNNIPEAVVLLGFSAIRNLVVSVSVIKSLKVNRETQFFDITGFWKHSIAVAMISKEISVKTNQSTADECFLGGLLHDIGKVVLYQFFPELFQEIWKIVQTEEVFFHEAERRMHSYNHARIGGYLARRWQLPKCISETIISHHSPPEQGAEDTDLMLIVHGANTIANTYMKEKVDKRYLTTLSPGAAKMIKPVILDINNWFPQTVTEIQQAWDFFMDDTRSIAH